ncbi:MAG: hypothetical protein MJZ24_06795 [Paludibacteraceae bacterium]|nr:hypothetical protein [Candidatus Physcocola equi]MCQ2234424.1 hypothetical protein [Paludibacteraceae bacterium]
MDILKPVLGAFVKQKVNQTVNQKLGTNGLDLSSILQGGQNGGLNMSSVITSVIGMLSANKNQALNSQQSGTSIVDIINILKSGSNMMAANQQQIAQQNNGISLNDVINVLQGGLGKMQGASGLMGSAKPASQQENIANVVNSLQELLSKVNNKA